METTPPSSTKGGPSLFQAKPVPGFSSFTNGFATLSTAWNQTHHKKLAFCPNQSVLTFPTNALATKFYFHFLICHIREEYNNSSGKHPTNWEWNLCLMSNHLNLLNHSNHLNHTHNCTLEQNSWKLANPSGSACELQLFLSPLPSEYKEYTWYTNIKSFRKTCSNTINYYLPGHQICEMFSNC